MSTATTIATLLSRIRDKKARIGVIGLGYVGLPLASEFARAGFDVTGFDVDATKVAEINAGRSYIPDVPQHELAESVKAGRLRATTDMTKLAEMDVVDICVPTPLRKTKDPDLSYVVKALEGVAASLKAGQLVILESTTYPGTTDEVALPMLEARGLKADRDFFLAFSPERVDPGNPTYLTKNIPKRSEEHTSELQSHSDLVCRLLLEKKKSEPSYTVKIFAALMRSEPSDMMNHCSRATRFCMTVS